MTELGRMVHLGYIKDRLLPNLTYTETIQFDKSRAFMARIEKSALIEKLKELKFVPDNEGNLQQASRYFDPKEAVFKAMHLLEDFPPSDFCTDDWLRFLTIAGLKCVVTRDMFVDYAQQVAANAAKDGGCQALEDQSETLVRHLWNREDLDANFLQRIKDIEFIALKRAGDVYFSLYPQHTTKYTATPGRLPFAKFQGSVTDEGENLKLAWSSAVIIPYWANPDNAYVSRNLGVLTHPTLDMIISHIEHVCDRQARLQIDDKALDEVRSGCLVDVIDTVFKNLEENLKEVTDAHIVRLQNLNCIPVEEGKVLVRPDQVVMELLSDDEIAPYFYKVPPFVEQLPNLCKKLLISKRATKAHYCDVLKRIHGEVGEEKMMVNQLFSSLKAFKGLIDLFNRPLQPGQDTPEANLDSLYVPTKDHRLVLSNMTILRDKDLLETRVSQLKNVNYIISAKDFTMRSTEFKEFYIQALAKSMIKKVIKALPEKLKPDLLSNVLDEKLEESPNEVSESTEMAGKISEKLQTPEFQEGLLRLIRNRASEDEENEYEEEEREHKETCNNLAKLTIEGRQELVTYMTYKGERIPGSDEKKDLFHKYDRDDEGNVVKCTLFVKNKTMKDYDDFWEELSKFIDQVTGEQIGNNVTILRKMFTMNIGRISSFLDSKKIRQLNRSVGSCPFPAPGDPIPIEDHHLLDQDFYNFRKGEYVGKFAMLFFSPFEK